MVNSRAKGARAERALCEALKEVMGWESARRSVQYCGSVEGGAADLVIEEVPTLHVESKMVEKLSIHPVMERAVMEAGGTKLAVVAHKRKRTGWLITCRLEDWLALSRMVTSACTPTGPSEGQSEKPIT